MTDNFELHFSGALTELAPEVTAASRTQYASGTALRFAAGREARLLLLTEGCILLHQNTLQAGSGLLLCPGQAVPVTFCAPGVLCELRFRGADRLRQQLALSDGRGTCTVFSCTPGLVTEIMEKLADPPEDCAAALYRTGLLLQLLSFLPAPEAEEKETEIGKQAMEYIRGHYMQPIRAEDVAKAVGVSRSWLYRCFMDYAAQSPTMYLRDLRMQRAKALLQRTKLPVQEIARAVGFEDALYFSRVFSEYEGCSPRAYRKEKTAAV